MIFRIVEINKFQVGYIVFLQQNVAVIEITMGEDNWIVQLNKMGEIIHSFFVEIVREQLSALVFGHQVFEFEELFEQIFSGPIGQNSVDTFHVIISWNWNVLRMKSSQFTSNQLEDLLLLIVDVAQRTRLEIDLQSNQHKVLKCNYLEEFGNNSIGPCQ